jgi:hypothetical protein
MSWIDRRLDALRRIKTTLDMRSGVSTEQGSLCLSEITLLETLKAAREALEALMSKHDCIQDRQDAWIKGSEALSKIDALGK